MGKVDVARIGCRTEIPARYSWRPRRKGKHARHELASIVEAMSLLMGTSLGRMRFSLDGEVSGTWTWFNLTPGIKLNHVQVPETSPSKLNLMRPRLGR